VRRAAVLALLALAALTGCATAVRSGVTDIKQDSAVLRAVAYSDRQEEGQAQFLWGTSPSLGSGNTVRVDFFANQGVPTQTKADNLQPETTYYWRVCARDRQSQGCSDVASFTTTPVTEDTVRGGGTTGHGGQELFFDARSGASGESPSGFVIDGPNGVRYPVACVHVAGNRANVGISTPGGAGSLYTVEDNGPGTEDELNVQSLAAPPTSCPAPDGPTSPQNEDFAADVRVVDALP
jgi:hypothetical protein